MRRACAGVLAACVVATPAAAAPPSPEDQMVDEMNRFRAENGVGPLRRSADLDASSVRYAGALAHGRVLGHEARIRVTPRWRFAGENLARHRGWSPRPRVTVRRWLASESHRMVLLSDGFDRVGVGRVRGLVTPGRVTVWVAHFGRL